VPYPVGIGLSKNATVEMKGDSSVTNNKVGIENNGHLIVEDRAKVSGNEIGIVDGNDPKKPEPKSKTAPEMTLFRRANYLRLPSLFLTLSFLCSPTLLSS
jgi:hypothetical protein